MYGAFTCGTDGSYRANGCWEGAHALAATTFRATFEGLRNHSSVRLPAAVSGPQFERWPHVMLDTMVLTHTRFNRQLMEQWLELALRAPRAFCFSPPPEEGAAAG